MVALEIEKYLREAGDKIYPSLYPTSALQALLKNVCSLGVLYKYKGFMEIHTEHGCDSRELLGKFHRPQCRKQCDFPSLICRLAVGFGE